ncbi:tetratricopeptide repeat protein [Candidatus Sumerlaeota bacterium]|nr:tetratricopeptide repeat protein [Candidatus Sumerlaeota bacterium]
MRECPQCYSPIFDPHAEICSRCGWKMTKIIAIVRGAESSQKTGREQCLDEEMADFCRQFEERGVFVTETILRKSFEVWESLPEDIPRATVMILSLNGESSARTVPRDAWEVCIDIIIQKSGIIAQSFEQGLLCIFGAPVSFDLDTEAAVHAAYCIKESLEQIPDEEGRLNFRIGIATGAFRKQGKKNPDGKNSGMEGGAISEAEKILSTASLNDIVVCSTTHSIIRRSFKTCAAPSSPAPAFKILERTPPVELPIRIETPFCGRAKEWQTLDSFFNAPGSHGGKTLHLTGEEGMGKTRLIKEYLNKNNLEKNAIWWEADSLHKPILLFPVFRWLRQLLNMETGSGTKNVRKSIRKFMKKWPWADDHDCLILEYIFGVREALDALRGFPPERIQRQIFALLHQLTLSHSDNEKGLLIIIDNAQWLDSLTIKYLKFIVSAPEASKITLVYIHPNPRNDGIEILPHHTLLEIGPLGKRDREHLFKTILPLEDFLPEIRKVALARSNGNTLFLEEISRLIHEYIGENPDLYAQTGANRIIEIIPTSLTELIRKRLEKLDGRSLSALQCASLLGLDFLFPLLEAFDSIREGLMDHLQALLAMNYLRQQPESDAVHYYFTHALFRDISYSMLIEEQKKRLHANLADHLEEIFRNRLQEYYELLAYHYSKGGETNKAVYYLVKAGDRQSGLGEGSNALDNYREALELLKTLPVTDQRLILMVRVLICAARLQRILGFSDQAEEMISAALDYARNPGNERLLLEARLEKAIALLWNGKGEEAEDILKDVILEATQMNCSVTRMAALNSLGVLHWQRGSLEQALRAFQELAAGKSETFHIQADAFNNAGLVYWKWGQYPEALKVFKRAIPLRRKVGDHFGLCATLMNTGIIQEQIGQVPAARKSYQLALELAHRTGYIQGLAALESNLSNLERLTGEYPSALEHALKAIEYSENAGDPYLASIAHENTGMAFTALGEKKKARSHYRKALEIAMQHKNTEREISARISLLELDLRSRTMGKTAMEKINQEIDRAKQRNYTEFIPRLYRMKGQALEILHPGNGESAREFLELAYELSRNSGSIFEEIESVQILVSWAQTFRRMDLKQKWEASLRKLKTILT